MKLHHIAIIALAMLVAACGSGDTAGSEDTIFTPDTVGGEDTTDQDTDPGVCTDDDNDGFYAGDGCEAGTVEDCNDLDPNIFPNAEEICGDKVDQDCDGQDLECPEGCDDEDEDGFFVGDGCPDGMVLDCNDDDPSINPTADEVCGDDIDQNCDGGDEACPSPCQDLDKDGHYAIAGDCAEGDDCDDGNHHAYPGAQEVCGDNVDQDCDGFDQDCPEECTDNDGDSYGDGPDCVGYDCNDANPNVNPGAEEICGNGLDDDCVDGDEDCPDTCEDNDGDEFGVGGACDVQDCDDDNPDIYPGAEEICGDGIDQDCNSVDLDCTCADNDGDGYGFGDACDGPDCNDVDPDAHPGAEEICGDGIDQDCDGEDDECPMDCDDGDNDGYGEGQDCLGPDCDDDNPDISPAEEEICGDGIDQDCSGADLECPPPSCDSDWDCGAEQICDLATQTCKNNVKVWEWWAPTFYVDTEDSHPGWNMPVAVDFDGDMNGANNASNIDTGSKDPVMYYSFVKTSTHWYLGYYMYFPRRWSSWLGGTEYQNMMTGVLLVIEQDGTTFGKLVLMETITEDTFFQYTPAGSDISGAASVDGEVRWDLTFPTDHHPIVYVHTQDHGVWGDDYLWNNINNWDENGFPDDDGVVYRYGNLAVAPSGISDEVTYRMEAVKDTLWEDREDIGEGMLYDAYGHFAGDDTAYRSVTPWRFYDNNFPTHPEGEIMFNPADFVRRHFANGWGAFSYRYVYNPYAIEVEIKDLGVYVTADILGGEADVYVNLYVCDGGSYSNLVLSNYYALQNNWQKTNVPVNTILNMQTELNGRNFFYGLVNPNCHLFGIEVRDYDGISGDEWLMEPEETHYYDFTGQQLLDWEDSDSIIKVTVP